MRVISTILATAAVCIGGTALPASAETVTLRDPGTQQRPANNLVSAALTYEPGKVVYRLKFEALSKQRTQAIARLYRPGFDLMITTKYVRGERRLIARRTDYATSEVTKFAEGVQVRWDFKRDVIRIVNTRFLTGASARMEAYTVTKGWMHGPYTEPNDFVSARVRRG